MESRKGDLFAVTDGILVHGCNAQGVMGSGVAAQVRSKCPEAYRVYREKFEKSGLKLGDVIFCTADTFLDTGKPRLIIANAVTQEFYGRQPGRVYVSYDAIKTCFERIREVALENGLSVHFPLIGCGLAGGDWNEVKPRIEAALKGVPATLWMPGP
jgi:O-acetyl-ADP-ribose deacetylase (regulator of RNase III)